MSLPKQKEYTESIVDTMFYHIRSAAEEKGETSFPSRVILMDAMIPALYKIIEYSECYDVDIEERDSIKIFAFTIVEFNKALVELREHGFDMDASTSYLACIRFLEQVYSVDFKNLPDLNNTTRILAKLTESDDNRYASYAYLKGLHEACLCI